VFSRSCCVLSLMGKVVPGSWAGTLWDGVNIMVMADGRTAPNLTGKKYEQHCGRQLQALPSNCEFVVIYLFLSFNPWFLLDLQVLGTLSRIQYNCSVSQKYVTTCRDLYLKVCKKYSNTHAKPVTLQSEILGSYAGEYEDKQSYGLLRRLIWYKYTDVSELLAASIIRTMRW
jgi:hypothetical protein